MGGHIKLFSIFEKGTCIRIAIPLTISSKSGILSSISNSENSQNLLEFSPKAPRHFTDSLKSQFEIIILYDHAFLMNQIQMINSHIRRMKINFALKCFEFNQNFNIKECEDESLFIIICSFDCNKALEIVRNIKKASVEEIHKNYSFSVFNSILIQMSVKY